MMTPLNAHVPDRYDAASIDLASLDGVLSTTRSVRLRLDLDRELDNELILDCIDLAEQAPGGGNQSSRRWLIIREPGQKQAIADLYMEAAGRWMVEARDQLEGSDNPNAPTMRSAAHLAERLADVPAIVIPCIWGRHDNSKKPGLFDSVIQSAWSFCLAARGRGLATAWTSAILQKEDDLRDLLDIPDDVTPIALLPVAWSKGTDYAAVPRRRAAEIAYFDGWGRTYEQRNDSEARSMSEGPGASVEIDVDASASAVWDLINDINISARFSEEFQGAEFVEGFDAPAAGVQFVGTNQHPAIGDWQTTSTITEHEPELRFGWAVGESEADAAARWRYEIDVLHGQRCRLRQTVRLGPGPSGLTTAIETMPDKQARILARRQEEHLANMQRCVEGIKMLAENVERRPPDLT
ncbi:MAG: nitroreductase [Candidatus Poriferisodalaceae bacterium]|jgi:nitroreductase